MFLVITIRAGRRQIFLKSHIAQAKGWLRIIDHQAGGYQLKQGKDFWKYV